MAKHVNGTDNIQSPEDAALARVGVSNVEDSLPAAPDNISVAAADKKKPGPKAKGEKPTEENASVMPQLSDKEMERLEAEARAEVEQELKANLAKEYKENFKASLKRKALFRDAADEDSADLVEVLIDLPPFCPDIRIDGVSYLPGQTYKMGRAKASTIKDMIYRAYRHEDETSGADANKLAYRRQRRDKVSGRA